MAQYTTGTVTVVNGSNIVTGVGTNWLTEVSVGDTFKKKSENAIYEIAAVDSNTQIRLSVNYAGSGESGAEYQITRDFTPNYNLAEINVGDKDWPYHLTQETIRPIDSALANLSAAVGISGSKLLPNSVVFANESSVFSGEAEFTYNSETDVLTVPILHLTSGFSGEIFDTDGGLTANSDSRIPTQKAVKTYVDTAISGIGGLTYKGAIDCSANPNFPAADTGDYYKVSVAGKIGGSEGIDVDVNDALICNVDSSPAGTYTEVGANWDLLQANVDDATTTTAGLVELATNAEALAGTDTSRVITPDDLKYVITNTKLSSFASTTSSELASVISGETGTGNLVFSNNPVLNSPQLITPDIGNASADSINNVIITEPASQATFTLGSGKTLTVENTVSFLATDGASVNLRSGGTVLYSGEAVPYSGADRSLDLSEHDILAANGIFSSLTDGKIPYHVNDSVGLADGPNKTDVDDAVAKKHSQNTDTGTNSLDFSIGAGEDDSITITVNNADVNKPKLKYNKDTNQWQYSNDGVIFNAIGSGGGGGVTDGNKGDITVSGESWTINPSVVSFSKIQNVASSRLLGRVSTGSGEVEELTPDQTRSLLNTASLGSNTFTGAQNFAMATVASASSPDIWSAAGNLINFTGTATVTGFPNAPQAGAERTLICAGACSFTAGTKMLIDGVASGNTMTCAANDKVVVRAVATDTFHLTRHKANGTAQVSSRITNVVTATTDTTLTSTPTLLQITPAVVGVRVTLPDATTMDVGGPAHIIDNQGEYAVRVEDYGGALVGYVDAHKHCIISLLSNSTSAGAWALSEKLFFVPQAGADITALNVVQILEDAKVYPYVRAGTVFNAAMTDYISAATLDSTHALICYRDIDNSYYGTAIVATISGTSVSFGSEYVFNTATTSYISAATLDSTHALICYRDDGNSSYGTASVFVSSNGLGIALDDANTSAQCPVITQGLVHGLSLTAGRYYYVTPTGVLTTTVSNNRLIGRALSDSVLLLFGS
jgi:hypothetical protein